MIAQQSEGPETDLEFLPPLDLHMVSPTGRISRGLTWPGSSTIRLSDKVLYYQVLRVPIIQFISKFYLVEAWLPHYQDQEQQTPTEARQSRGIPGDLLSHYDIHIALHSHQVRSGQSLHCCKSEIGFYAPGSGVVTGGSEVIKCRQESSPESIEDEVAFQWVCFIKSGQNRNIYQVGTLNPRFSGKKTNNLL